MSSLEIKSIVALDHKKLVIYADVGFDSAQGPYIAFWEVMEFVPGVHRDRLKSFDLTHLGYEDFTSVAEALTELCDSAIVNETIYADLEAMHIDRYLNRE